MFNQVKLLSMRPAVAQQPPGVGAGLCWPEVTSQSKLRFPADQRINLDGAVHDVRPTVLAEHLSRDPEIGPLKGPTLRSPGDGSRPPAASLGLSRSLWTTPGPLHRQGGGLHPLLERTLCGRGGRPLRPPPPLTQRREPQATVLRDRDPERGQRLHDPYKSVRYQTAEEEADGIRPKDRIILEHRLDGTLCFRHGDRYLNHPWKRNPLKVGKALRGTPAALRPTPSSPRTPGL